MTMITINEVKLYERNAKAHPQSQIDLIINSIKTFGWRQPILVNNETGEIVAGHGRFLAWKQAANEMKMAWVIDDLGQTISGEAETRPLTADEEKAFRMADNQINALSGVDMELIKEELAQIPEPSLVEITGYPLEILEDGVPLTEEEQERHNEPKVKMCPHCGRDINNHSNVE